MVWPGATASTLSPLEKARSVKQPVSHSVQPNRRLALMHDGDHVSAGREPHSGIARAVMVASNSFIVS